jgi:hypothetical protein
MMVIGQYRAILLSFLCLALGIQGCATVYNHPTKGQTEFYADSSSCEATAGQAAGPYDTYGIIRKRVYRECMQGKGWTPQQ